MNTELIEKHILALAADLGLRAGHLLPSMALMAEFKRIGATQDDIKHGLHALVTKGWLTEREMLTEEGYAQIA